MVNTTLDMNVTDNDNTYLGQWYVLLAIDAVI